jgi:4-hydroxy-3-methylbut-2-enyl diphosphate reductase
VCRPTKQRQTAAVDLARKADVVIVVGGATSNNTRQLVDTCSRYCARVYHVQTEADVSVDWLEKAETVGLTAGTSTPADVVDRVEARIRGLACGNTTGAQVPAAVAL